MYVPRALQDRAVGPSSSRVCSSLNPESKTCIEDVAQLQHLPSTSNARANEGDLSMARQFFDHSAGPSSAPQLRPSGLIPMGMPNMLPMDLTRHMGDKSTPLSPNMQELWAQAKMRDEMQRQRSTLHDPSFNSWATEFQYTSQVPFDQIEVFSSPAVMSQSPMYSSKHSEGVLWKKQI